MDVWIFYGKFFVFPNGPLVLFSWSFSWKITPIIENTSSPLVVAVAVVGCCRRRHHSHSHSTDSVTIAAIRTLFLSFLAANTGLPLKPIPPPWLLPGIPLFMFAIFLFSLCTIPLFCLPLCHQLLASPSPSFPFLSLFLFFAYKFHLLLTSSLSQTLIATIFPIFLCPFTTVTDASSMSLNAGSFSFFYDNLMVSVSLVFFSFFHFGVFFFF